MKNKIVNITIIIGLLILISFRLNVACTGMNNQNSEAESSVEDKTERALYADSAATDSAIDTPSQYHGNIPSDSGAVTQVILHLGEATFTEVRSEPGSLGSFTAVEGVWRISADTLYLADNSADPYATFFIQGDDLNMQGYALVADGSESTGSLPENREELPGGFYDLRRVYEFDSISAHHQRLQESGVRFVSSGNEPFWSFRVTEEGLGQFSVPDSTIETRIHQQDPEQDSGSPDTMDPDHAHDTLISHDTGLRAEIEKSFCQDTMSGVLFTHTVSINFKGVEFTGCGTYL